MPDPRKSPTTRERPAPLRQVQNALYAPTTCFALKKSFRNLQYVAQSINCSSSSWLIGKLFCERAYGCRF